MDIADSYGYNPASMTIRRYILNQLAKLFLGASAVLYCVMFIVELVKMGTVLSFKDIDVFLLALIPMAAFVFPMALMFSILMVLEKLSIESEVIAMQACGVKKRTINTPIIMLSVICMLVHVSISTYLGPLSMQKIQSRLILKAPEKVYAFLKEREFIDTFKNMTLYIESINQKKKRLTNVFIEMNGKEHSVIAAERGTLESRPTGVLMKLTGGSVYMVSKHSLRYLTFDEYNFFLEADFRNQLSLRSVDSLTQPQLKQRIVEKDRPPKLVKEYYSRFAFPFLNIILALIGLQFGVQKPRSPRNVGIIIGVCTILSYYLLFLMVDRLVKGDLLNPTIGAWIPDFAFCFLLFSLWAVKRLVWKGGI